MNGSSASPRLLTLAAVVILVAALKLAAGLLVPVALAVLLSFMLGPIVNRLERRGLGQVTAVIVVAVAALTIIGSLGWLVTGQILSVAQSLPTYRDEIRSKVQSVRSSGGALTKATDQIKEMSRELSETPASAPASQPAALEAGQSAVPESLAVDSVPPAAGRPSGEQPEPIPVRVVEPTRGLFDAAGNYLGMLLAPLGTAGLVFILVVFMLLERREMRDRLIRVIGLGRMSVTTEAFDEIGGRISRYLLMQLVINVSYGVPVGLFLWIMGLPNPLLWGLLCTVLRFLPYVGPWLGASMPILLSIAVFEGWTRPLGIIGFFIVLELISNNVMEPVLYGRSTGISTMAVVAAAVFWAWLWGPIGLLLSTPMTVCLAVIGKHIPQLAFLNVVLGDQPALEPGVRFYQRLLAMDSDEIVDLVIKSLESATLVEVCDQLLVPALRLAEIQRHKGGIGDERLEFIHRTYAEIEEELAESPETPGRVNEAVDGQETAKACPKQVRSVVIVPVRDKADELIGLLLRRILARQGIEAQALSAEYTSGELVEQLAKKDPEVIIISALPPLAVRATAVLCRRLKARFGGATILVGLWQPEFDQARVRARLEPAGAARVMTTLADAAMEVRQQACLPGKPPAQAQPGVAG